MHNQQTTHNNHSVNVAA